MASLTLQVSPVRPLRRLCQPLIESGRRIRRLAIPIRRLRRRERGAKISGCLARNREGTEHKSRGRFPEYREDLAWCCRGARTCRKRATSSFFSSPRALSSFRHSRSCGEKVFQAALERAALIPLQAADQNIGRMAPSVL